MNILNLLAGDNYFIYNKDIAKLMGPDVAIILGLLCSKYNYYQKLNKLLTIEDKEYFYCTRDDIFDETGLKEACQRKAMKILEENKILEHKKIGIPSKNYYYINQSKLMEKLETSSSSKIEGLDTQNDKDKKLKNCTQIIYNNSNNENSNNINSINTINMENLDDTKNSNLEKSKKQLTEKQKKAIERNKILEEFIKDEDEDIQQALKDYVEIRKKKGLEPKQLQILLEDFEKAYKGKSKSSILEQIRKATAGGWLQLVYTNFIGTTKTSYGSKPSFDNTAGHNLGNTKIADEVIDKMTHAEKISYIGNMAVADMTPKQREFFNQYCLARDSQGKLLQF